MHTILYRLSPAGAWTASRRLFSPFDGLRHAVVLAVRTVMLWGERRRQRQALAGLDDAMLKDIGLSRADALFEADKPFWRD